MARGIFSLAILVGLLCIAFVLREFTAPWQVGNELQKHTTEITELQVGMDSAKKFSEENRRWIQENRTAIKQNSQKIASNRAEIEKTSQQVKQVDKGAQETFQELRALFEKVSEDNRRLSGELKQLKRATAELQIRLQAVEKKLKIAPPAPGTVQ